MGDGIIYIIIAVLIIVFLCLRKSMAVLICAVATFLMYCYEQIQMKSQMEQAVGVLRQAGIKTSEFMAKGAGFYLLTIAVFALLILSILMFLQQKKTWK